MMLVPVFFILATTVSLSSAFIPCIRLKCGTMRATTAIVCNARKISMKEKRKRRQSRQQRKVTMEGPPVTITRPSPSAETSVAEEEQPTQQRAKELLAAQRDSVKALTEMRESLERHLNGTDVKAKLERDGYATVDNFLGAEDLVDTLHTEAVGLYNVDGSTASANFTRDLVNLGCSIAPLQGGSEQYFQAPRCIEWVVALTKHGASVLGYEDQLDKRKTQGQVIVFDRNTRTAALDLLKSDVEVDTKEIENNNFKVIVEDLQSDLRRLSVMLFLVKPDWNDGGGFKFNDGTEVAAKRNRLVLINSTDTRFVEKSWRGSEQNRFGSVLQVHLIKHQAN